MTTRSLIVVDSFFNQAEELREHFDDRFGDSSKALDGRFIWDYWHVPDQYTLLRTPAYNFFPKKLYENFHRDLVLWGRENLGCHDISPPWMSCYVDGCEQQLHGDLPHGPWAFVYSLTLWSQRRFDGGETLIVKDPILSYWKHFRAGQGLEHEHIFEKIPAKFNRLTVFDPRVPHGVKRVEGGVRDVRKGRLVIHGWFVQPRPFIQGDLKPQKLQNAIDGLSEALETVLPERSAVNGVLSVRFNVTTSGKVQGLNLLTNTLRSEDPELPREIQGMLRRYFANGNFGKQRKQSAVTLPLVFESS